MQKTFTAVAAIAGISALAFTPVADAATRKKATTTTTKAPVTAAPTTAPVAPATAAPVATAAASAPCSKKGGAFVDNWNYSTKEADHLDPALNTELIGGQINNLMFDTLTRSDSDGKLQGDVAESWSSNANSTVWTFKLKKGVKFTNGEAVLPSTFKKSWERFVSPALASEYADIANVIKGWDDVQKGKTKELAIKADDAALTLEVTMSEPYGIFPSMIQLGVFSPVPAEALSKGASWEQGNIVGNGAFKIDKRVAGQTLKLVRNDDWFGGITGHTACLDSVEFKVSKDPISAYADFEAGNSNNGVIPVGKFSEATGKYGDRATKATLSVNYLQFNWNNKDWGGFANTKIRQAVAAAVDRKQIIDVVYNGAAAIPTGIVPPGIPGFNKTVSTFYQKTGADTATAQRLIAEYGKPVPPLSLYFRSNSTETTIAQLVQAQLKTVGIDVKLEPQVPAGYFTRLGNQNWVFAISGWALDYPGQDNVLNQLFHTSDDSSNNRSDFSSGKFDQLTEQGRSAPDPAKSASLYNQAEALLLDTYSIIPFRWGRFQTVLSSKVDTYPQNGLSYVDYASVTLK